MQDSTYTAGDSLATFQHALRSRLPALDGLRGLAVISVVWHNSTFDGFGHGLAAEPLDFISSLGWVGVQLFFVLSGFLITGILLDEKGAPHQFRNFYMRRVLRIFPIYYAVLIVAFIVLPALGMNPNWSVANKSSDLWYWTYMVNWAIPIEGGGGGLSHFWSLSVEEQFYLLWPLAAIALSRRTLARVCVGLIASAPLLRALLIHYDPQLAEWGAYEFTFARWDALGMGALLSLIVRDRSWLERFVVVAPRVFLVTLAYSVFYVLLRHNFAPVGPGVAALNQSVAALLFALMLFYGVYSSAGYATRWQRVLAHPALRHVGKYSYALYVLHYPVVVGCGPLWRPYFERWQLGAVSAGIAHVFAVSLVSYVLARCSWVVIEQPFLRMKRFFSAGKHA